MNLNNLLHLLFFSRKWNALSCGKFRTGKTTSSVTYLCLPFKCLYSCLYLHIEWPVPVCLSFYLFVYLSVPPYCLSFYLSSKLCLCIYWFSCFFIINILCYSVINKQIRDIFQALAIIWFVHTYIYQTYSIIYFQMILQFSDEASWSLAINTWKSADI